MTEIAKVVALTGQAYVVGADGLLRTLKLGDQIEKGEIIRTTDGARVELLMADGQTVALAPDVNTRIDESMAQAESRPATAESAVQAATVDAVIQALDRGDDLNQTLEAAAAGLGGGAESGGDATFVRLLRIVEPVDPLAYNYTLSPLPTVQSVDSGLLPESTIQPVINVTVTNEPLSQKTDGPISISPDVIALSVSGMQVIEGTGADTKMVNFLFALDKVALTDITITFVVRPGSATAEVDFTDGAIGTPVTVTIPAGVNGFAVPVNIVTDSSIEGNETFNIQLLSANGASLGNTTAEVTIMDDDILLSSAANLVDETGGLDQVSGNLNVNYSGSGSTPVISLKADGATWNPETHILTDNNGEWQTFMDTDGAYTFTQLKAMSHSVTTNPDDAIEVKITANAVTSVVVNGITTTSTATGEIVVTVRDDGPTVTLQTNPVIASVTLDESDGLDIMTTAAATVSDMFASSVFGQDGAGTANYKLNATDGVVTGLYATSDTEHVHEIKLVKISDTQYEGWSDGNTATGIKAFTISIDGATGVVTVTQNTPLDHPQDGDEHDDSVGLQGDATVWVSLVVTDSDGDAATAGTSSASALSIIFKDDGPTLSVSANAGAASSLALALDETSGPTDLYAPNETTDTAIDDDANSTIARQTTAISGGLSSLFSINATTGADGGTLATSGTLSLQLLGATAGKVATTLSTVDGGLISLEMSGSTVLGKDTLGHTVLNISIVSNQLQVTLLEPLNHSTDGSTAYDEALSLWTVGTGTALQLLYTVTQTDADGDTITQSNTVNIASVDGGALSFDDDGPTLSVSANAGAASSLALALDETSGPTDLYAPNETTDTAIDDDANSTIARQTTAISGGLSSLFSINATTGADGGTLATSGTLSLQLLGATAGKVATTLSTVDGGLISLEMSGSTVLGKDTLGHTVLNISIVSNQLQVTLLEPLNHSTDGSTAYDEALSLWTVGTGTALQLLYTVTQTDADGDTITQSNTVNIASVDGGALSFDDDGPTLSVSANAGAASSLALALDETSGPTDLYAPNETTDTAIDDDANSTIARQTTAISGGLSSLFSINATTGADGGTLATSGTLSLQLLGATAGKVATTLSTVDGGLISLEMSGSTVLGKDTLGHTVLNISIVSNQLQVTLLEPLNHSTDGSTAYDEALSLWTVGTGTALQLLYTVTQTDADGDTITQSNTVNIASVDGGALSFDDDGPTLTGTNPDSMAFNLSASTASSPVSGTYTFDEGTDAATFGISFGVSTALIWNNQPTGYSFVLTDSTWNGTTDHSLTWTAYNSTNVAQFKVILDDDGHYHFQLLASIGPAVSSTSNLMSGISGGSNLASYDFAASNFGGAFILQLDGKSKDGANYVDSTVTISSTELGVAGNSIQPDSEKLVLNVLQQTGYEDASIAKIYMSMADTGGLKSGDSFTYEVFYTNGSSQTYSEFVPDDPNSPGNPGIVVFDNFDASRVVSSIEIWTTNGGATWKVDGLSVDYYKNISANDTTYSFTLTGQDGDGDTASTNFTVNVGVGTAGDDQLLGGSGNDQISAGAGEDVIFGGQGIDVIDGGTGSDTLQGGMGNDILTGGGDADIFKWTLGDMGTVGTPALDTVTDFAAGVGGDTLDLRDLLDLNGATAGNGWTGSHLDLATALKGFVQITDTDTGLQLTIDTNGLATADGSSGSNQGAVQTVVLDGIYASTFGVTATGALTDSQVQTILNKMLTDGNLKHD